MEAVDPYEVLRRRIEASELSPGERLVEEEIAERLGSTRGAVRAALLRLNHDGLVVRERNRGAHVRRITIEEGIEILEARTALESLAAGYAALRRSDEEASELFAVLGEMQQLQEEGELLKMSARNGVLHRRILDISAHHVAIDICAPACTPSSSASSSAPCSRPDVRLDRSLSTGPS